MEYTQCETCDEQVTAEYNDDTIRKYGACSICLRKSRHQKLLVSMSLAARMGEVIRFEIECSDNFATSAQTYKKVFSVHEDGFALTDVDDQLVHSARFSNWESLLYAGPKSFSPLGEYRRYRQFLSSIGVEYKQSSFRDGYFDWQSEYELQFLADQKVGYVITEFRDNQEVFDRWIFAKMEPFTSRIDAVDSLSEKYHFGNWHVHELNFLIGLYTVPVYFDKTGNNPIKKSDGIADALANQAAWIDSLDKWTYFRVSSGIGYNETGQFL